MECPCSSDDREGPCGAMQGLDCGGKKTPPRSGGPQPLQTSIRGQTSPVIDNPRLTVSRLEGVAIRGRAFVCPTNFLKHENVWQLSTTLHPFAAPIPLYSRLRTAGHAWNVKSKEITPHDPLIKRVNECAPLSGKPTIFTLRSNAGNSALVCPETLGRAPVTSHGCNAPLSRFPSLEGLYLQIEHMHSSSVVPFYELISQTDICNLENGTVRRNRGSGSS
jgi:hypothetical protein